LSGLGRHHVIGEHKATLAIPTVLRPNNHVTTDHKDSSLKGKTGKAAPSVVKVKTKQHTARPSAARHSDLSHHARRLGKMLAPLLAKRKEYCGRVEIAKQDYVDVKSGTTLRDLAELQKSNEDQIQLLRSEARAVFGTKAIKIRLAQQLSFTASAGGVLNSVNAVLPTAASEWASLAALFDEFTEDGGEYQFAFPGQAPNQAAGTSASAYILVLAYDPDVQTALASTVAGCELEHHKLFCLSPNNTYTVSTNHKFEMLRFGFSVPKGVSDMLTAGSLPLSYDAGNWQGTTSGTFIPYGFMRMYLTGQAANGIVIHGMLYHHARFRIRE
jgi:hypothetical protein